MARCLSFHAGYQCRRSGACCSAGWTIPFDREELETVHALPIRAGSIALQSDGGVARREADGRCAFLEADGGVHACEIHRVGGHAALPLACRMFPRLVLHDARDTFVSLSHFCPTAVDLLFEPGPPAAIVDAPSRLTGLEPLDGLDAREVWPPLLRPGVMMDLESYGAWERLAVELLTREGVTPRTGIDALATATARVLAWHPSAGMPLTYAVRDAFGTLAPKTDVLQAHDAAVKRWLAARLFGSWIAYQGDGLATIVRYLRACHDLFTIELARDGRAREAIRRCDRLIVHESSSQQLATLFNDCS